MYAQKDLTINGVVIPRGSKIPEKTDPARVKRGVELGHIAATQPAALSSKPAKVEGQTK